MGGCPGESTCITGILYLPWSMHGACTDHSVCPTFEFLASIDSPLLDRDPAHTQVHAPAALQPTHTFRPTASTSWSCHTHPIDKPWPWQAHLSPPSMFGPPCLRHIWNAPSAHVLAPPPRSWLHRCTPNVPHPADMPRSTCIHVHVHVHVTPNDAPQ